MRLKSLNEKLSRALRPSLDDVRRSGLSVEVIDNPWHPDRELCPSAELEGPPNVFTGIFIHANEAPGVQAVQVAETMQEVARDILESQGRLGLWPACPRHRVHALQLNGDEDPAWLCPETGEEIAPLGLLLLR